MMRNAILAFAFFAQLLTAALAQELVISGRVLDTGSPNADAPVVGATVVLLNALDVPVKTTITNGQGFYNFPFDALSAVTGKEHVQVKMEGYSRNPTPFQVRLARSAGEKVARQEDVLLTNEEKIRKDSQYRDLVAHNTAQAAAVAGQKEKASAIYASIAGLPSGSKELVFETVNRRSGAAYSELLRVNEELNRASELRKNLSPRVQVQPQFDQGGRVRFSGAVSSQQEMDTVLRQAGDKGFNSGKIVNDMRVQKGP